MLAREIAARFMTKFHILRSVFSAVLMLSIAACAQLPRDPHHTLDRIRQAKHMHVGLVENPPWVMHGTNGPDGVEVRLIQELSTRLGASPDWRWGGEQSGLEALKHFELDLLIGGLDAATPWSKEVGLTRPYYVERFLIGMPAGTEAPASLNDRPVSVISGEETAAYLSKKGAKVIRVANLRGASAPVAAPEWRLWQLGLIPRKPELLAKRHVMATPPGENAWLKQLQEFLATRQVGPLLQSTVTDK
jgi:polar amino acid transport system substrate-binding protein